MPTYIVVLTGEAQETYRVTAEDPHEARQTFWMRYNTGTLKPESVEIYDTKINYVVEEH